MADPHTTTGERCSTCDGEGECDSPAGGTFPCEECDGTGEVPATEHRGSCRIFYSENVCTCGAPDPKEPT